MPTVWEIAHDPGAGLLSGDPESAECARESNGSQDLAHHNSNHTMLHPSSALETRDQLLEVTMRDEIAVASPCEENGPGEAPASIHSPTEELHHRRFTGSQYDNDTRMILPQVHLRKPCYDFSFL